VDEDAPGLPPEATRGAKPRGLALSPGSGAPWRATAKTLALGATGAGGARPAVVAGVTGITGITGVGTSVDRGLAGRIDSVGGTGLCASVRAAALLVEAQRGATRTSDEHGTNHEKASHEDRVPETQPGAAPTTSVTGR
jgi:hypothetical protein